MNSRYCWRRGFNPDRQFAEETWVAPRSKSILPHDISGYLAGSFNYHNDHIFWKKKKVINIMVNISFSK